MNILIISPLSLTWVRCVCFSKVVSLFIFYIMEQVQKRPLPSDLISVLYALVFIVLEHTRNDTHCFSYSVSIPYPPISFVMK